MNIALTWFPHARARRALLALLLVLAGGGGLAFAVTDHFAWALAAGLSFGSALLLAIAHQHAALEAPGNMATATGDRLPFAFPPGTVNPITLAPMVPGTPVDIHGHAYGAGARQR